MPLIVIRDIHHEQLKRVSGQKNMTMQKLLEKILDRFFSQMKTKKETKS